MNIPNAKVEERSKMEALLPTIYEFRQWAKGEGYPVGSWNASDSATFYSFFIQGFRANGFRVVEELRTERDRYLEILVGLRDETDLRNIRGTIQEALK